MGYVLVFLFGGLVGAVCVCACVVAGRADDREEMMMRERWKDEAD